MQYDGYGHRQGEKTLNESEKFYQENLYPLQDGVLNLVKNCKTHFYLTGGTALSRIYYNHRYSDDLDFFVNADIKFNDFTLLIYNSLLNHGYEWSENDSFVGVNYKRLLVRNKNHPNVDLKLDFVNDIDVHYGELSNHTLFDKIDSIQNILSNKISALFRYAEKDIADLLFIARNYKFHWEEIISQARSKELGIETYLVSDLLLSFPKNKFDNIKWIHNVNYNQLESDLKQMAKDCLEVKANSLCLP